MAKIKYSDIYSPDVMTNVEALKAKINEIDEIMRNLPKIDFAIKGSGEDLKKHEEILKKILEAEKKLNSAKVKIDAENKRIAKEKEARNKKEASDAKKKADAIIKEEKRIAKEEDKELKKIIASRKKAAKEREKISKAEEKELNRRARLLGTAAEKLKAENVLLGKVAKSQKELREQTNILVKRRDALDTTTEKGLKLWDKYTATIAKNTTKLIANDKQIKRHQRNVGNYQSAFNKARGAFLNFSNALGIGGAAAIGSIFVDATKKVIEFEKSLSQVQAITRATDEQMQALKLTAKELGATTAFSATEATKGMVALGQAGFSTNEIMQALPGVLGLATVGGIELGEAADIASNVLSGFGLAATETQRVVDILALSASSANVTVGSMGVAFKEIASTAAVLKVPVEEVGALINTLGNSGIKGTDATNALQSSLIRLSNATPKSKKAMNDLGLEVFDQNGEFVGLTGTIEGLEEQLVGLTTQQKLAAVGTIFGVQSANQWLTTLESTKDVIVEDLNPATVEMLGLTDQTGKVTLKGSEVLKLYTSELENAEGAADKMAKTMLDNLAGDITLAGSAYEGFILSLEDGDGKVNQVARGLVQFGTEILNSLTTGNALTEVIKAIFSEFSGLFQVLGKVISVFTSAESKISAVDVIFKVLSITLQTAFAPLRLIIWGITQLAKGFLFAVETVQSIQKAIIDFALSFDVINKIVQSTIEKFNFLKDVFISFLEAVGILDKEMGPQIEKLKESSKETDNLSVSTSQLAEEKRKQAEAEKEAALALEKSKKATEEAIKANEAYENSLESLRDKSKSVYDSLITDVFEKNEVARTNELQALDDSLKDLSKNQQDKIRLTGEYKNAVNAINLKFDTEEQKLQRAKIKKEEDELNKENNRRIKANNDNFKSLQKVSAQQFRSEIIELKKAGADKNEIAVKEKEFKIQQLQEYLDFVRTNNTDLTEDQKLALKNTIAELELELDNFGKSSEGIDISGIIAKKLGITKEGLSEIVGTAGELIDEINSVIDDKLERQAEALEAERELSDERIELLNNELEEFESVKSQEAELLESEIEREQNRVDRLLELGVAATDNNLAKLQADLANQQAIDAQKDAIKQAQIQKDLADEKAKNAEIEKEQKRVAEKQKRIALARSVINTAVAVGNALATVPFPANIAVASLLGAKGILEFRKIQAQEFAEGTEFVQRKGAKRGIDTVPAMLTEGERVISVKDSVKIPRSFKNSQIPEAVNYYLGRGGDSKRESLSHNYTDVLNGIRKNTSRKNRNQVFEKGKLVSEKIGNVTYRYN